MLQIASSTASTAAQVESETHTMNQDFDLDICSLLGALTLKGGAEGVHPNTSSNGIPPLGGPVLQDGRQPPHVESDIPQEPSDAFMEVIDSQGNMQFIQPNVPPTTGPHANPPYAPHTQSCCALLRDLCDRVEWHVGRTSSADFLEAILAHRESFMAFPQGHRGCSNAFTQLAFMLERRGHEGHVDGDIDTAIALHNEAWLTAGWA